MQTLCGNITANSIVLGNTVCTDRLGTGVSTCHKGIDYLDQIAGKRLITFRYIYV